jgi:hypothetical protein
VVCDDVQDTEQLCITRRASARRGSSLQLRTEQIMALYISADKPQNLLAAFKKAVDDGHIVTWTYKKNGDFVHTPEQWKNKAVMRPSTSEAMLQFGIVGREGVVTWPVYGVYHGRLIEEFLSHFSNQMKTATATAQPVSGLDEISK